MHLWGWCLIFLSPWSENICVGSKILWFWDCISVSWLLILKLFMLYVLLERIKSILSLGAGFQTGIISNLLIVFIAFTCLLFLDTSCGRNVEFTLMIAAWTISLFSSITFWLTYLKILCVHMFGIVTASIYHYLLGFFPCHYVLLRQLSTVNFISKSNSHNLYFLNWNFIYLDLLLSPFFGLSLCHSLFLSWLLLGCLRVDRVHSSGMIYAQFFRLQEQVVPSLVDGQYSVCCEGEKIYSLALFLHITLSRKLLHLVVHWLIDWFIDITWKSLALYLVQADQCWI